MIRNGALKTVVRFEKARVGTQCCRMYRRTEGQPGNTVSPLNPYLQVANFQRSKRARVPVVVLHYCTFQGTIL